MAHNNQMEDEFVVEEVDEESQQTSAPNGSENVDESQESEVHTPTKGSIRSSLVSPSQELFEKYVKLENNLKNLQRKYDGLLNDKTTLDKVLKSKDAALVKTTMDFESSVEQLEKLKDAIRIRDNQIKNLKAEKRTLEELSSISQLTNKRKVSDAGKNRTNVILPEDSLDRIIALENELKLRNVNISTLESEIHTLKAILDKKDKAISALEESFKASEYKRDKVYETESKNADLVIQLEKAQKEIRTLQEISRMKTKTIEKLNEEIETLKTEEENYKDQQRKSLQTSKELDRLKLELKVARRSIDKKEKEMDKIVNERDTIPLKSLEGDKRYLQNEIKKHLDKLVTQDRTISFQEKKIESYKQRLAHITQAIKETKLDKVLKFSKNSLSTSISMNAGSMLDETFESSNGQSSEHNQDEETVSEVLYNVLQKDVEELRRVCLERDITLTEKDTVIEALEKKVDILEKAKVSDQKAQKRKIQELQEKIDELTKKISSSEEQFKQHEKQLKKETLSVKKKLHQTKGIVKK